VLQDGKSFVSFSSSLIHAYKSTHIHCRMLTYDPSTALVLLSFSSHGLLVDVSLVIDPDAVLSTVKWGGTLDPNVDYNWMHERKAWVWVMGWLERSEVGRVQCTFL
jgi:hypothetical protein